MRFGKMGEMKRSLCGCEECEGVMVEGLVYAPDAFTPATPVTAAARQRTDRRSGRSLVSKVIEDHGDG